MIELMTRLKVHHMAEGNVPQADIAERCGIGLRPVERILTEPPPTPPDIVTGERAEANRRGRPGHKGTTRELRPVAEADRVVDHWPDHCEHCQQGLGGVPEFGKPVPHQQYELPPLQLDLIHHWLHQRICPQCGEVSTGTLAAGEATGQGPRLTSFIALLSSREHHQSRSQVVQLLDHLFGVRFSNGTIQSRVERVTEARSFAV